jgi:hypothetical protein
LVGGINGAGATTTSKGSTTDLNAGTGPNPLINLDASAATADSTLTYVVGSPDANQPNQYCCSGPPSSQTFALYNVKPGRINQWQLSVEHQFGHNLAATVGYVGSHGSNLAFPTDLNQITNPTVLAGGPTTQAERPYPLWGNLTGSTYNAISNYNALQATVTKRYSNGLLFSFNYVWSHFLDDQDSSGWGSREGSQNWQIGNDPSANYANSNFNIPQAFKGYAAYDLPFGNGKQFLSSASKPVNAVVGGWRISGTMITQSGNPFTITNAVNNSYSQCSGCAWYVDRLSNPMSGVPSVPSGSPPGTISYFNTAAVVGAAPGTFGNNGRNSLNGPRLTVFNMSIAKGFNITERINLELRSDWVNAFNHPSFGPPSSVYGGGNFGLINGNAPNGGIAVAPRSGQLSAKITF